jgi:hypothetical protein
MRDVQEYYAHVINLVAVSGLSNEWHKIKLRSINKTTGYIRTIDDIQLTDGAVIHFVETILIQNQVVQHPKYSYQFARDTFYFRYDRDPDVIRYPEHAECHLHVNQTAPRYITHVTNFEEFFAFVKASFYPA